MAESDVRVVASCQRSSRLVCVSEDQRVLGVSLFRRLREIEAASSYGFAVEDHNFVWALAWRMYPRSYACPQSEV